jgi:endogenous inhibitor of DNA gyrase (YacG/DUF329 family)
MSGDELRARCPTCRKPVVRNQDHKAPYFPFCSERCKLIDLGKWFGEEHRIPESGRTDVEPPPDGPGRN